MDRRTRARCPLILVDRIPPQGFKGEAVVTDNVGAAYEATRHLIGLGHELIAMITGRLHLSPGYGRAEGYRKAMQEAHLPIQEEYFKHGSFRWEMGYQYGLELLRGAVPPTAILSANYVTTVGLLRAFEDSRVQCPEEISMVGFDDFETGLEGFSLASMFCPKLTAVAQPCYMMGKKAAELLLELIAHPERASGETNEGVISMKAELRVRESTAPPPLVRSAASSHTK
jgi:LacI family transcriptional regulator